MLLGAAGLGIACGGGSGDESAEPDPTVLGDVEEREPAVTTTTTRPRTTTTSAPDATTTTVAPATTAPATTIAPPPTTATAPAPTRPVATTPPTTAAPVSTTTTTAPPCQGSTDPACGPLEWSPPPDDQAPTTTVDGPATAVVGEPVTFRVVVTDPDGHDGDGACAAWSDSDPGTIELGSCEPVVGSCERHGPHATPAPVSGSTTYEHSVTFTEPGDHTVQVDGATNAQLPDGCPHPYASGWSAMFTVTVAPAPGP